MTGQFWYIKIDTWEWTSLYKPDFFCTVQNNDGDKKRFAGLQGKTQEQQNTIE